MKKLDHYLTRFTNLNTARRRNVGRAPHKPILLLAVLEMMETGQITENRIPFSPELLHTFRDYWESLQPVGWHRNPALPFRHLAGDGFWHLSWRTPARPRVSHTSSVREHIEYAELDPELYELLRNPRHIRRLRRSIFAEYFPEGGDVLVSTTREIGWRLAMAEELKAWEDRRFVMNWQSGRTRRNPRFATMVMHLYDRSCAMCRLHIHTATGVSLVDAAHILPRAEFRNDDPRNGIALCKNHHWAFDHGLVTFTTESKVEVSPLLDESAPTDWLLTQLDGIRMRIPKNPSLHPEPRALQWHRKNVFWAE